MSKSVGIDYHVSVMPQEVLDALQCSSGKIYVDCTTGGAGHSQLIAQNILSGKLICLDVDSDAINQAKFKLSNFNNVEIIKDNYYNLPNILSSKSIDGIDGGILLDLGVSYHQLTSENRGFTFQKESQLDMRMDQSLDITALDLINSLDAQSLEKIFRNYSEERYARRISMAIKSAIAKEPILTTTQLANVIKRAVPYNKNSSIHPATRVFQALRIAVNNELEILEKSLHNFINITKPGARIAVITFHSLEDRIVKNCFKYYSKSCICPVEMIECRCNNTAKLKIINKKPLVPSSEELLANPSSRSAKLRVVERI